MLTESQLRDLVNDAIDTASRDVIDPDEPPTRRVAEHMIRVRCTTPIANVLHEEGYPDADAMAVALVTAEYDRRGWGG